jgi:hypothetical protein
MDGTGPFLDDKNAYLLICLFAKAVAIVAEEVHPLSEAVPALPYHKSHSHQRSCFSISRLKARSQTHDLPATTQMTPISIPGLSHDRIAKSTKVSQDAGRLQAHSDRDPL